MLIFVDELICQLLCFVLQFQALKCGRITCVVIDCID